MQPTIPTVIAALLPLLATIISSWLNDDHLPPWTNACIAACALVLTAIACEFLSAGLPISWVLRLLGVLAYVGILMNGDLSVLYGYLVAKPSPISPKPPAPTSTQTITTQAVPASVPTPITLPPGSSPVPPRASAPPTTPGA